MLVACEYESDSESSKMVGDAYRVCSGFEGTELVSGCKVDGGKMTVDVRIDTNGSEANKLCAAIPNMVSQHTVSLRGIWKLRIFSPFSGEYPLAVCSF